MYSVVSTAIIHGIEGLKVSVEVDVSDGLPVFKMVGFLSGEVKEASERVRTALKNCGYLLPVKRITVNIFPADVKKTGTGFDLPIAVGILTAMGIVPEESIRGLLVAGEISLDGNVRGIPGILPIVSAAKEEGITRCMIPFECRKEAELVTGMEIFAVKNLKEAVRILTEEPEDNEMPEETGEPGRTENAVAYPDFADIHGQKFLKRACEVAVSGMHNFLMVGPPGAGKTMAACRIPSILPPMEEQEKMELSKIYSVAGMFEQRESLIEERPFRSPHHTITPQGMAGGGIVPKPGEISLAHGGVLFLDELTEFDPASLELLRQPLEQKEISLVRVSGSYRYPAKFMLVCAMNPCRCGYYPDMNRCSCSQAAIDRFAGKISMPLLDRIDICVETHRVEYEELTSREREETSEEIRQRVMAAFEIQKKRYAGESFSFNSEIPVSRVEQYLSLGKKEERYMKDIYRKLGLSARAYHKVLKAARTIADISGHENIELADLSEAVLYRSLDKKYWRR